MRRGEGHGESGVELRLDLRIAFPDVVVAGVVPAAAPRHAHNNIVVLRCGTLVGRSVPGVGELLRHKLALDGCCLMSCARSDEWQDGLRRDLYFVRPFRSMVVIEGGAAAAAAAAEGGNGGGGERPTGEGASAGGRAGVEASVEVEGIYVDATLDKISKVLDITLSVYSATAALDWGLLPDTAGHHEGGGAGTGEGAQLGPYNAWAVGWGVGGLSGMLVKAVAGEVQPLMRELAPCRSGRTVGQVAMSASLKCVTVLLRDGGGRQVGAVQVLATRARLVLGPTRASISLECRRALLLDPAHAQAPAHGSFAPQALDADRERLHALVLADGGEGARARERGGRAAPSDSPASCDRGSSGIEGLPMVALLDFGGPPGPSDGGGGDGEGGGGGGRGSDEQGSGAGGFMVGEMRVLLPDDAGWNGKEVEAQVCRNEL